MQFRNHLAAGRLLAQVLDRYKDLGASCPVLAIPPRGVKLGKKLTSKEDNHVAF